MEFKSKASDKKRSSDFAGHFAATGSQLPDNTRPIFRQNDESRHADWPAVPVVEPTARWFCCVNNIH